MPFLRYATVTFTFKGNCRFAARRAEDGPDLRFFGPAFFRVFAGEGLMGYDAKTVAKLEELATNLRLQIALHPDYELERVELKECERWIELRRHEPDTNLRYSRTTT